VTRTLFLAKTSLCAALAAVTVPSLGHAQGFPPAPPPEEAGPPLEPAAAPEPEAPEPEPAPPAEAEAQPKAPKPKPRAAEKPPEPEPPVLEPAKSWFYRDPISMKVGNRLTLTLYGQVAVAFIYDTTRSYGDTIGSSLVARTDTYEGTVGRFQASSRGSRFGLALDSKEIGGITPSSVLEADFSGDQPTSNVGSSERSYYDSPTFRLRHAYINLADDYVDVLIGQTDDVFGWQNTPSSTFRHTQFRLSHTFGASAPVGLDIAAAALRPVQRDSQMPDAQAGLRLDINAWKGIYTRDGIPTARPLSLGVSGVARQFDADAFTPPPTQTSNKVVGWGLSVDAVVPVIPARDEYDRGNALTLAGSFVTGTGIGDLMRVDGGARFPPLPNPARAFPAPEYDANVDEGLVTFDRLGVLNTIDWQGFRVDAQYYFPPSGRVRIAAIYTQAYSKNMQDLYPQGGAEIELLTHVADRIQYVEGNLYWDVTPEFRLGTACIYTMVQYLDQEDPHNIRGKLTANYYF
jgi:hypothetical protein